MDIDVSASSRVALTASEIKAPYCKKRFRTADDASKRSICEFHFLVRGDALLQAMYFHRTQRGTIKANIKQLNDDIKDFGFDPAQCVTSFIVIFEDHDDVGCSDCVGCDALLEDDDPAIFERQSAEARSKCKHTHRRTDDDGKSVVVNPIKLTTGVVSGAHRICILRGGLFGGNDLVTPAAAAKIRAACANGAAIEWVGDSVIMKGIQILRSTDKATPVPHEVIAFLRDYSNKNQAGMGFSAVDALQSFQSTLQSPDVQEVAFGDVDDRRGTRLNFTRATMERLDVLDTVASNLGGVACPADQATMRGHVRELYTTWYALSTAQVYTLACDLLAEHLGAKDRQLFDVKVMYAISVAPVKDLVALMAKGSGTLLVYTKGGTLGNGSTKYHDRIDGSATSKLKEIERALEHTVRQVWLCATIKGLMTLWVPLYSTTDKPLMKEWLTALVKALLVMARRMLDEGNVFCAIVAKFKGGGEAGEVLMGFNRSSPVLQLRRFVQELTHYYKGAFLETIEGAEAVHNHINTIYLKHFTPSTGPVVPYGSTSEHIMSVVVLRLAAITNAYVTSVGPLTSPPPCLTEIVDTFDSRLRAACGDLRHLIPQSYIDEDAVVQQSDARASVGGARVSFDDVKFVSSPIAELVLVELHHQLLQRDPGALGDKTFIAWVYSRPPGVDTCYDEFVAQGGGRDGLQPVEVGAGGARQLGVRQAKEDDATVDDTADSVPGLKASTLCSKNGDPKQAKAKAKARKGAFLDGGDEGATMEEEEETLCSKNGDPKQAAKGKAKAKARKGGDVEELDVAASGVS
jgi:hypothetical protein